MDITCIMSRHPIHPPIILPSSAAAHLVGDAAKNNLLSLFVGGEAGCFALRDLCGLGL